jgi:type IV pilus assembly protein PilA
MTVIAMVGTLLVLAIVGLRKYLATAKTGEAKNTLGQLAKDAVIAYERELPDAAPSQATHGSLCPSASRPVPLETSSIRGRKYQSTAAEWSVDEARDAGFACLRFELMAPQYYQVIYEASPTSFTGTTRGDLDGDGQLSTFTLGGEVHGGRLWLAPTIREVDPDE